MRHPALIIDLEKLKENTRIITELCQGSGIDFCAVTKAVCARPEIAQAFLEGGATSLADSRVENLMKLESFPVPKLLLRIPMPSEADEVVRYADASLNSEWTTLERLSQAAVRQGLIHGVILMTELGDLREGVLPGRLIDLAGWTLRLPGVRLLGIGTNLNCYGGVIPDEHNLTELVVLARQIETAFKIPLQIVSGGNSGSIYLTLSGRMPAGVNHLRLGEVLLLGRETSFRRHVPGMHTDAFTFRAEIVELQEKPSMPSGQVRQDAFGHKPHVHDRGLMLRAIVACGRQDIPFDLITPRERGVRLVGASSDHLILDVTSAPGFYAVGDTIDFSLAYGALVAASTSEYVHKVFVHE